MRQYGVPVLGPEPEPTGAFVRRDRWMRYAGRARVGQFEGYSGRPDLIAGRNGPLPVRGAERCPVP